jgi:hypothetical protein
MSFVIRRADGLGEFLGWRPDGKRTYITVASYAQRFPTKREAQAACCDANDVVVRYRKSIRITDPLPRRKQF